jgi:nucleoid-associated protein YgaU
MDRTPDNERSNPISRAFSKFFERGKVGEKKPQATPRAGAPTHAATRQATPQPRVAAQMPLRTAASTTARPAQPATPGLQTAASTSAARPATPVAASTGTAAPAAAKPRTHTVERGDTLSGIAKRVYGRADRWNVIYQANRDQLDDPDRIYPGQVLVIPDAPSVH